MIYYDPDTIRPKRDWVFVVMEPRKEVLASGIILPIETGEEKVTEGVATILKVGGGVKNDRLGLRVGDRVALRSYLKYANPVTCRLEWPDGRTKEHFLVNSDDLIAVLPEGMEMGVFSSPANRVTGYVND